MVRKQPPMRYGMLHACGWARRQGPSGERPSDADRAGCSPAWPGQLHLQGRRESPGQVAKADVLAIRDHFPYLSVVVTVRSHTHEVDALIDTGFTGHLVLPIGTLGNGAPPDTYYLCGLDHDRWVVWTTTRCLSCTCSCPASCPDPKVFAGTTESGTVR